MKAVRLVAFGDPPEFAERELPDPAPEAGQVVVELRTAALNRRDRWIWTAPGYCPLPVTLGSDGAGVVAALGAGVSVPQVGDEVVIYPTLGWPEGADVPGEDFDILGAPTDGTFAEAVVVDAAATAPRPQRLTWEESGSVPLAGLTAWRALFTCGKVGPGSTVLVTGAGSGVASFLLQFAVAAGATVAVTTGSDAKAARALELGAVAAARYGDDDWPEAVRTAVGPLDVVIDSYGADSFSLALPLLRRGGTFVSFGDTGRAEATFAVAEVYWEWRSILGTSMGSPEEFRAMLDSVNSSSFRPVIDSVFPLEQLPAAARRLESADRFGKVVLDIAGGAGGR